MTTLECLSSEQSLFAGAKPNRAMTHLPPHLDLSRCDWLPRWFTHGCAYTKTPWRDVSSATCRAISKGLWGKYRDRQVNRWCKEEKYRGAHYWGRLDPRTFLSSRRHFAMHWATRCPLLPNIIHSLTYSSNGEQCIRYLRVEHKYRSIARAHARSFRN